MSPTGFVVTVEINGAHPMHEGYPLLAGDLLILEPNETYAKVCPGLAVTGFVLTPQQRGTLRPVTFRVHGFDYEIVEVS